ncbi:MAG TPA: PAS domain-containing protein, partial [Saliniramus sp.]|nr:PAS domain-containing protein [Saliniramus sp.]
QISTEELESSNEELCSANEEMSSLNEELQIVNAELAVRLDELSSALTDIQNLLASTQIAVVFLDHGLRVRLFTPAATDFYNFTPGDIGRPISDLRPLIKASSLEADAKEVMLTLEPVERVVSRLDGETFYRMKILPYRTAEDAIGGVVVTYTPEPSLR